jgi:hypothetical protein
MALVSWCWNCPFFFWVGTSLCRPDWSGQTKNRNKINHSYF